MKWQPIDTAPREAAAFVVLRRARDGEVFLGRWGEDGWEEEDGTPIEPPPDEWRPAPPEPDWGEPKAR